MRTGFGVIVHVGTPDAGWNPSIDSASLMIPTILAYRTRDDAAASILPQREKFGLPPNAAAGELPAGLWGIWLPSRGSDADSVGEWLEPSDDDGVPSALLFADRESAQRALELLMSRHDHRMTWDAVVRSFDWDGPGTGQAAGGGEEAECHEA